MRRLEAEAEARVAAGHGMEWQRIIASRGRSWRTARRSCSPGQSHFKMREGFCFERARLNRLRKNSPHQATVRRRVQQGLKALVRFAAFIGPAEAVPLLQNSSRKNRWVWVNGYKSIPPRLKPINFAGSIGTTEVVPFQNRWSAVFPQPEGPQSFIALRPD